jgi:hypothetical protein
MEEPFQLEIQSPEIFKVRKPRKPRKPRAERAPRKPRVKKPKPAKKVSRRVIVARFVNIPKRTTAEFWKKELTILRQIEQRYGFKFLSEYVPVKKVETLAFYYADWKAAELEIKRNEFYYQPQPTQEIVLTDKAGEDFNIKPKPTLKEFLS